MKQFFVNMFSWSWWKSLFTRKIKDEILISKASQKNIDDMAYSSIGSGTGNCVVKTKSGCVVVCPSSSVKGWGELHKDSVVVKPAYKTYSDMAKGDPKVDGRVDIAKELLGELDENESHIDENVLRKLIDENKKKKDATNSDNR